MLCLPVPAHHATTKIFFCKKPVLICQTDTCQSGPTSWQASPARITSRSAFKCLIRVQHNTMQRFGNLKFENCSLSFTKPHTTKRKYNITPSQKTQLQMVLPNLLLPSLNLLLFLLSLTSFLPLLLLRTPPAPFGWALLTISSSSLTASVLAFFSHLLFIPHIASLLLSTFGEAFIFFSLLLRPDTSIHLLDTTRGANDAAALVRIEMGVMATMFVLGSVVLVLECVAVEDLTKRKRMARVEVFESRNETELVKEIVEVEMEAFQKKNEMEV